MSKKQIRWFLIIFFIFIGTLLGHGVSKELEKRNKLESGQKNISKDNIVFFDNRNIKDTVGTVFSLFHPACDFCQADAEQFFSAKNQLSNLNVFWVSYDVKDSIQKFSKTYGLDTISNMHFAYMDIEAMLERYGNVKFPTFLAYNEQGQLLKKFVGLTKPEEIIKLYQIE